MDKSSILKDYFGYTAFRPWQAEIVDDILAGRDVFGVMPTGAGKSICYQVPALLLDGLTLVISPLISLMKDQVNALDQNGIRAAYINSSLASAQVDAVIRQAMDNQYKIIYVAPERLMAPAFLALAKKVTIAMVTIDEAHCISQWGQDFRPSYLKISEFIGKLARRPIISAFTATATQDVRDDIVNQLQMHEPKRIVTSFDRENLFFAVQRPKNKDRALIEIVRKHASKSGIVYCSTRKAVEEVCDYLQLNDCKATRYHAGLPEEERSRNQDDFLFDRQTIMVATNAFGMGIDKSNVSFVVHYNMPMDVESYYQEAGRAGRDGSLAECTLLFNGKDVRTNTFLIDRNTGHEELPEDLRQQLKQRDHDRLKAITIFSTTNGCLREYLLRYFGETSRHYCGKCSNCLTEFEERDVTDEAKVILSCIYRMAQRNQRFGKSLIADVLAGSQNARIAQLKLDTLTAYGYLARLSRTEIINIIDNLVEQGHIVSTGDQYPVLTMTQQARTFLGSEDIITIKAPRQQQAIKQTQARSGERFNTGLFEKLKELRSAIAREERVPAYIVFTDATLNEMCRVLPKYLTQFIDVTGVGAKKTQKYGARFLKVIAEFQTSTAKE